MSNELIVNVNPMGKPRMSRADRWKKRPCVLRYFAYSNIIKEVMLLQNFQPANELIMTFYVMMPKSWSKKKKAEMVGTPMQSKADIDNIVKGVLDSLLKKDETVWKICASKRWAFSGQIIVKNWEKDISIK